MTRLAVAFALVLAAALPGTARATTVTLAGTLQSELGCPGDWQPDCAATHLTERPDGRWSRSFSLPAGMFQYKLALDDTWDVSYGAHGGSDQIALNLAAPAEVTFYLDPDSHWVADDHNAVIAVAPGTFQSELGCAGDWAPDCLRSWLEDVDGDGVYGFDTTAIPKGAYETKVALNEAWVVNYGAGGAKSGANIPFTVARDGALTQFRYTPSTHVLTVGPPRIRTPGPGPAETPTPTPGPSGTPTASPTPTAAPDRTPAALTVRVAKRQTRRGVRRRGVRLVVTASEPCRVVWRLRLPSGRRVGGGHISASPASTRTRSLRLKRPGRRRFRRAGAHRLRLTVAATDRAGNRAPALRRTVRLQ